MTERPGRQTTTDLTRQRYNRIAAGYDRSEDWLERLMFSAARQRLWARVRGPRVLEVGVGTGRNLPNYPPGLQYTAIDLSPAMLAQARRRAAALGLEVNFLEMDAEHLSFADAAFDTAVATCVFCSVPEPVRGLAEMRRVVRPGGQMLLLEHMRAPNPLLGRLMDALNPLVVHRMGANINRRTLEHMRAARLKIVSLERLSPFGIVILVEATP